MHDFICTLHVYGCVSLCGYVYARMCVSGREKVFRHIFQGKHINAVYHVFSYLHATFIPFPLRKKTQYKTNQEQNTSLRNKAARGGIIIVFALDRRNKQTLKNKDYLSTHHLQTYDWEFLRQQVWILLAPDKLIDTHVNEVLEALIPVHWKW